MLSSDHDITLLGPSRPRPEVFHDRLGIDLTSCNFREVDDDESASTASSEFDVFVNCTYSSRAVNRAPIGIYYVHFPRILNPRPQEIAWKAGLRLVRLAERIPVDTTKFATAERLILERLGDDSWVSTYTRFVANSAYTKKWIRRIWSCDSEVVHPPVRSRVGAGTKGTSIVSIVRFFDPEHGHSKKQMEMLTVFDDMVRSYLGVGEWRLALIGGADGVSRDYVMRIRRAAQGLPIDVHVNARRDFVDDALARASIYWHASGYGEDESQHPERFEHFGIAVVEAMAAGAVPIVFAAGGPAEIVRDGVDGFHWSTPEQLARLTRTLMADDELMRSMSQSAMTRSQHYLPEVFDRRLRALVSELEAERQVK